MKLFLFATAATVAFAVPTFAQMADGGGAKMMRTTTRADAEARAKEHFARLDLNHDGFVTPEEIHAGIEQRMAAHRGQAFDRLDTDHNGTVTREEFSARPEDDGGRIVERRVERTSPDGAKDGKPGTRMMMMHQGGPEGGEHMIMMTDTDHDGRISEAESVAGALKMFDMADTNHDGSVTPEERKAAMAAWGTRMHREMGDMPPPPPPPAG